MGLGIGGLGTPGVSRGLGYATARIQKSFSRLASGMRIPSAAEGPSGLVLSERLRAVYRSFEVAEGNIADGVGLAQTAETAAGEVSELLGRARELALEAADETLSDEDRALLDDEFQATLEEIDRIAGETEYNGAQLLDGSAEDSTVQAGPGVEDTLEIGLGSVTTADLGLDGADLSSAEEAGDLLGVVDGALEEVSGIRSELGASIERLESARDSAHAARDSLVQNELHIRDLDMALESAKLSQALMLHQAGVAVLAHSFLSGPNAGALLAQSGS